MSDSKRAFWCTHRDGYTIIAFPPELASAHMADVRDAGLQITGQLETLKAPVCLVDLSALNYMGSSLVASVVRIWKTVKARDGRMVIVASNDQITGVLKASGLTKVWTIVDSFEAGVHALGCSPEARVEKRERRLLAFVSPIALIGAAIAVTSRVNPKIVPVGSAPEWMIWNLVGLSILASAVSMFREKGWRWFLSVFVLLSSVLLTFVFLWMTWFRTSRTLDDSSTATEAKGTQPGRTIMRSTIAPTSPDVSATSADEVSSGTDAATPPISTDITPPNAVPSTAVQSQEPAVTGEKTSLNPIPAANDVDRAEQPPAPTPAAADPATPASPNPAKNPIPGQDLPPADALEVKSLP